MQVCLPFSVYFCCVRSSDWIREDLVRFASANPELNVRTELKRAAHPLVRGQYLMGNSKTISLRNMAREDVEDFIMDLRNQIGKKVLAWKTLIYVLFVILMCSLTDPVFVLQVLARSRPVERAVVSVQGEWHERMPVLAIPLVVEHKN
jgi:hypothetical protein